jgi:twitching motility protein PilT
MMMIETLVRIGKEKGASDLHLDAGSSPVFRVRGELLRIGEPVTGAQLEAEAQALLGRGWDRFMEQKSVDLSKTISGVRCRFNVFQTVRGVSFAIRLLSSFRGSIRDCNLHPDLKRLIQAETGLVIVSGPTGSGKSTTLAALIEELNGSDRLNIITIEKPIEYYDPSRQSFIRQREIPRHSPSFEQAIMDSMREDPDVLVIGEMREPEVMRLTLNAAETGHLVLATMHSSTCAEAISRLCMSFPAEIQPSIRSQIADCLVAVVCQRLHYLPHLQIRVPVLEILTASSAVKGSIRAGNFSQLISCLQTGAEDGMFSFERYRTWMDQKKDWVKPSQATPHSLEPTSSPELETIPEKRIPPVKRGNTGLIERASIPASSRIEINPHEDDLEALARQIAGDSEE